MSLAEDAQYVDRFLRNLNGSTGGTHTDHALLGNEPNLILLDEVLGYLISAGGVKVHVHIEKAAPGTHGLHIHEMGDCSDPKGASAGGLRCATFISSRLSRSRVAWRRPPAF